MANEIERLRVAPVEWDEGRRLRASSLSAMALPAMAVVDALAGALGGSSRRPREDDHRNERAKNRTRRRLIDHWIWRRLGPRRPSRRRRQTGCSSRSACRRGTSDTAPSRVNDPPAEFILHQRNFLVRLHVDDAAVADERQFAVVG